MSHTPPDNGISDSYPDPDYLRPDRLRIGDIGVFAGSWAWVEGPNGPRIPVGFVGTLIGTWNGWAVFTCTREVAEAIVADQNRCRADLRADLEAQGVTGTELTENVDERITPMHVDGDEIVTDERLTYGEEGLHRDGPDDSGMYVINGWRWTWSAVSPSDCDHIAGHLPPDTTSTSTP